MDPNSNYLIDINKEWVVLTEDGAVDNYKIVYSFCRWLKSKGFSFSNLSDNFIVISVFDDLPEKQYQIKVSEELITIKLKSYLYYESAKSKFDSLLRNNTIIAGIYCI